MTRRPKTPRTSFERKWFDFHTELHDPAPLGYRRQPKGRRAKSGQWFKRTPCPVPFGYDVEYELARLSSEWRMRDQEFRIAIDEIPDDDVFQKGWKP